MSEVRGIDAGFARGLAARSVASAFRASVARHPTRTAVIHDGGGLSYRRLDELTNQLAHGLRAVSDRRHPVIAVLAENNLEHTLALLAAAKSGATIASLNWRLSGAEREQALQVADPDLLIVSPRLDGPVPRSDRWRMIRMSSPGGGGGADGAAFWDVLGAGSTAPLTDDPDPESIVSVVFTSGSTGDPKAAAISHRALVARAMVMRAELQLDAHETYLAWTPMSHMTTSDYTLIQLMIGGTVAIVDGFDVPRIVELLASRPVGWLPVMPGTYEPFLAEIRRTRRPFRLRVVGAMADLLRPELIAEITTVTGAQFFNSFGSTEAGTVPVPATFIPVGVVPTTLRKTQTAFCDVRLVRDDGSECEVEEAGEMLVRGPTLFSGYWRNPEATAVETLDGWYRSGDILVRHDDGTLDFIDRRKYMIKSGGENIYPAEVERALLDHPAVAEAAVVRASDETWGERPVAFVVRADHSAVTETELIDHVGARLARFKRPRSVMFVEASDMPRNLTGKIVRRDLERRVRPGR